MRTWMWISLAACVVTLLTSSGMQAEWFQEGQDIDGEGSNDRSGYSISLSSDGNRVVIGAWLNWGSSSFSGHARVYERSGSSWVQLGSDLDGEADTDASGWSVAISSDGSRIAIGAPGNDGNGFSSGHVRVYGWMGGTWWSQYGGDIDGEAVYDQSGRSVSLSSDGSRVAIGAQFNDGNGSASGHVRVFEWSGAWVQKGSDIDGETSYDESGSSVALSPDGSRLAIGAPLNDGNGIDSGHVRVYEWSGSAWVQMGSDIDGEAADDQSGSSVALSSDGSRLAIGAPLNDGNGIDSGHVRVYEWSGSSWIQSGSDNDGEAADDQSGSSIALSSDGSRVAIGAPLNDGNGIDSGHVRVYEWSGSGWTKIGSDIDGEAEGDNSGRSVALSSDGNRVAVGAPYNWGYGDDSGHVRVYGYYPPPLTPAINLMGLVLLIGLSSLVLSTRRRR